MARGKKKKEEEPVQEEIRPFEIIGATLNDDICNYSYEVMTGPTTGETHSVKGKNIIHDDLREAFRTLNRHLAAIDDAFDAALTNIDKMENNAITAAYDVHGFKMKGSADNQSISLIGTKHVKAILSRNDISTDKIALDDYSAYKWHNELSEASKVLRDEVLQYMNGKCTPVDNDDEADPKQLKITDQEEEFEDAKL